MTKKIIPFEISLKSTKRAGFTFQPRPQILTNDANAAELNFIITDARSAELLGVTATVLLFMKDGSFFQNTDVTRVNNTFVYTVKPNQAKHKGIAQVQLVIKIGSVENASPLMEFEIVGGLETKPIVEREIQDWTSLTKEAKAFVDQIEGFTLESFVENKMGEELANLEVNYATRLTGLETSDQNITAQLDQTIRLDESNLSLNNFNEHDRAVIQGLAEGEINAVLGYKNVTTDNIATNAVSVEKVDFIERSTNLYNSKGGLEGKVFTAYNTPFGYSDVAFGYVAPIVAIEPSTTVTLNKVNRYMELNSNLEYITGGFVNGGSRTVTTGSNTRYLIADDAQGGSRGDVTINLGTEILPPEPYFLTINNLRLDHDATQDMIREVTAEVSDNPLSKDNAIEVSVIGNEFIVRYTWDDDYDFVEKMAVNTTGNKLLNFTGHFLYSRNKLSTATPDVYLKFINDDITPLAINGDYIGANHGWLALQQFTSTSHGLTTADIGSEWTQGANKAHLVAVIDTNTLHFIGKKNANNSHQSIENGSLTNGVKTLTLSGKTFQQWRPSVKNITRKVYVDKKEVLGNFTKYAQEIVIVESYDINVRSSMYDQLLANVGKVFDGQNPAISNLCRYTVSYSFGRNGSCVIKNDVKFYQEANLTYIGGIQSGALSNQGGTVYNYIPNSVNLETPQELNPVILTSEKWKEPTNPPNRFVTYVESNNVKTSNYGFTGGYAIEYGAAKKQMRQNINTAIEVASTKKYYPRAIDTGMSPTLAFGDTVEVVAYRIPINYNIDPHATNVSWYWVGDDIYLMLDYHKNINKFLKLPSYMNSKKIEVIEKSDSFSVNTDIVGYEGLDITVSGSFGFAVLKLTS